MSAHTSLHHHSQAATSEASLPRVCIVGLEGGGTSELAHALAEHYGTVCVPEYASIYSADKVAVGADSWWPEEFTHIARTQSRIAEEAERGASKLLICDTDAFSVWVWHQAYVRHPLRSVREIAEERPADLYVLVDDEAAASVDASAEYDRSRMRDLYRRELRRSGQRFAEVSGTSDQKVEAAVAAIEALLGR
jgi:HTH-type transcriptional repressor of NAD biosynthesis genes